MNDGLLFIWMAWFWWIILTFFMSRSYHKRLFFAQLLLLMIISQKFIVQPINTVFVVVLIILCYQISSERPMKKIQMILFTSFCSLGYSGIKLIVLYDPYISLLDEKWFLAIILCIIVLLLPVQIEYSLYLLLLSVGIGEFILLFTLNQIGLDYPRMDGFTLDLSAISITLLLLASFLFRKLHKQNK